MNWTNVVAIRFSPREDLVRRGITPTARLVNSFTRSERRIVTNEVGQPREHGAADGGEQEALINVASIGFTS